MNRALKVSLAIATAVAVYFSAPGLTPADAAALGGGGCLHHICDVGGTCTTEVTNHTCCFVEPEGGGDPVCASDSCILEGPCGGPA